MVPNIDPKTGPTLLNCHPGPDELLGFLGSVQKSLDVAWLEVSKFRSGGGGGRGGAASANLAKGCWSLKKLI